MEFTKSEVDDQGYAEISISGQNIAKTAEILNTGWGLYKVNDSTWNIPEHSFYAFKMAAVLAEQYT